MKACPSLARRACGACPRIHERPPMKLQLALALLIVALPTLATGQEKKEVVPLPGTRPLTMEGDLATQMVEGIDRFLLKQIEESVAKREQHWKRDFSSPEAYNKSI